MSLRSFKIRRQLLLMQGADIRDDVSFSSGSVSFSGCIVQTGDIERIGDTTLTGDFKTSGSSILGDGRTTSYTTVSASGSVAYVGDAGVIYGEIYTFGAGDEITISGCTSACKVQITSFSADGQSNGMTPAHAQDHITVLTAGMYLAVISVHIESAATGGADTFGITLYKNNGATEFPNVHAHRRLAGGGGDVGSVSVSGIVDLAVNDTVELWIYNEDSTDNVVIQDITLSLMQIGGT